MPVPMLRHLRAPSRRSWQLDYLHLSVPNFENFPPVVNVSQDEIQVSELIRPPQKIHAAAAKTRTGWSVTPTVNDVGGLPIPCQMSPAHQSGGDPGATTLVFFPELTPLSGADDGNTSVTLCQVAGKNGVTAKASQIQGFTTRCLVNHLGAR